MALQVFKWSLTLRWGEPIERSLAISDMRRGHRQVEVDQTIDESPLRWFDFAPAGMIRRVGKVRDGAIVAATNTKSSPASAWTIQLQPVGAKAIALLGDIYGNPISPFRLDRA
jgi:hypothetical protein